MKMNQGIASKSIHQGYEFTDHDFRRLRELVYRYTGIRMADNRRDLIYNRLSRRLSALGLASFAEYREFVEQGHEEELEAFCNAVTTNHTAFFREAHHFDYLTDTLIPELLQRNRDRRRLRIWSAGCSSGEEPYTLAMVLRESIPDLHNWDVRILATDIDSSVLARAVEGIYHWRNVKGIPDLRLKRWFQRGKGRHQGQVRVKPELRQMICFRKMNLLEGWPMKGPLDLIFCRNVLIYFDQATQARLFERFSGILRPEGHLFIGHSESPMGLVDCYELIGKSIYRCKKKNTKPREESLPHEH